MGIVLAFRVPISDSTAGTLFFLTGFRELPFQTELFFNVLNAVLGALAGSILLWGAAAIYKLVRKRDGMGMGDVKMMAMVGAFLGPRGAFLTILLGTLFGTIIGVLWIAILYQFGSRRAVAERAARRGLGSVSAIRWTIALQYQLPLGTFLGVGAMAVAYALPGLLAFANQYARQ
jgi:prepilin signal peptidase PulO-like enzyme (type II secretory pathway)